MCLAHVVSNDGVWQETECHSHTFPETELHSNVVYCWILGVGFYSAFLEIGILQAQRSLLSQDKIQKQLSEIQKKNVELERLQNDTAQELQRKEMQHVGAIVQEMRKVIETYAKEKKIDIVLEGRAGAIYANPALDITDEIVKRFDNQWKKRK